MNRALSVKRTDIIASIAQRAAKSKLILKEANMHKRTDKKDPQQRESKLRKYSDGLTSSCMAGAQGRLPNLLWYSIFF